MAESIALKVTSAFLVGGDGRILAAWRPVKPEETVPRALEAAALQDAK